MVLFGRGEQFFQYCLWADANTGCHMPFSQVVMVKQNADPHCYLYGL